jgi:hypothetical protein
VQKSGTFAEAHAKVEDGDDPKAEPPTRGRESGWRASLDEELQAARQKREHMRYDTDPARFHELPAGHQERLRMWVHENASPRNVTLSACSIQLKDIPERFFRERREHDPYVGSGAIAGALIEAGYEPVDEDEWGGRYFRVGPKPSSEWADRPHGPRVLGPPLFYESVRIPEYPASRAARRMREDNSMIRKEKDND